MKILAVGDVVGASGVAYLEKTLKSVISQLNVDFTIVNGENANEIHGISVTGAERIFAAGADVITLGNHAFASKDIYTYLDDNCTRIIRPANYPPECPGVGYTVADCTGYRILCMNVSGVAFMDTLDNPFDAVETILAREEGNFDYSILDMHAEATSEKYAVARYFDGRINAIFGTHTHVATADESILPGGTAYVTDIGMTGPKNGILGTDTEAVLRKMKMHLPAKFTVAKGDCASTGVIIQLEDGKATSIKRVKF